MITLGIETSCDETSCAVLKDRDTLLSNIVSSSLKKHALYGGVVPEIASRQCLEAMDSVYETALNQAKITAKEIDLIAVTRGPGLIGSLLVGMAFAKGLSYNLGIPLVGVNHLEAHLDGCFIDNVKPKKPFIGLLVSGGHSSLVYCENGNYELLGQTVDDAVGEAYDKVGKLLGLPYPGGPVIDRLAREGNPAAAGIRFTKPKQDGKYDFSFSGIKTAAFYFLRERNLTDQETKDFCAAFQNAVVAWIVEKTFAACEGKQCGIVAVGGGVSANSLLRARLAEEAKKRKVKIYIPEFKYTTDNAAMIARNGIDRYKQSGASGLDLTATPNLKIGLG